MRYLATVGEREIPVEVMRRGPGRYTVRIDGREREVEWRGSGATRIITVDGREIEATIVPEVAGGRGSSRATGASRVLVGGRDYPVRLDDPLRRSNRAGGSARTGRIDVCSFMPGKVTALLVREGDRVEAGQGLVVVEAMKMENEIPAPRAGGVVAVEVRPGETVEAGAVLLRLE